MREMTAEKAAKEIRRAYGTIGQEFASLLQVSDLVDLTKEEITAGILHLMRTDPAFYACPEANQKVLSLADHQAAVTIGNQAKHLISWG